jgi:hypothetical protein
MLVDETLVDNTQLLLQQRLQLVESRYVGLQQLRQHDLKLIANIKLLQQRGIKSDMPAWLHWLANTSAEPLALVDLKPFLKDTSAWLVLHEIKALLQPNWLATFIAHMQQTPTELYLALFWQLAIKLQLKLDPFSVKAAINSEAIWYIACSGQPRLLKKLRSFATTLAADEPLLPLVNTTIYSYSYQEKQAKPNNCAVHLVQQLIATKQLQPGQLILLLTAATEAQQNDIINLLINNINTQSLAILALAIIGKSKFIALLLELAQQTDTREAAADSLACLLGVIEADTLLCDVSQLGGLNLQPSTQYLAGKALNPTTLSQIWQQGNQQQRRIAAWVARLSNNKNSWSDPDSLLGGIWQNQ